ncbi:predicted protein [Histoplasma capsulatum var. duboisii H88]|uniref:Predicted protein n=1 Tax=Ajellomyces capsulatus (strain H88) TaxID=544711 RepID=F0UP78_AJEC8|nr:predicted protein [Histoplasma capsulatum var. duboisii H88]
MADGSWSLEKSRSWKFPGQPEIACWRTLHKPVSKAGICLGGESKLRRHPPTYSGQSISERYYAPPLSNNKQLQLQVVACVQLSVDTDPWDVNGKPELGPSHQPWRAYWPPNLSCVSERELSAKPWLTWKHDPAKMNNKPWYDWVRPDLDLAPSEGWCPTSCVYCGGKGCGPRSTGAEGA